MNARPITRVSHDSIWALASANFLIPGKKGTGIQEITTPINNDFIESGPGLIKRLEQSEECLKEFWSIWHRNYIQFLRERSQNDHHHQKIFREPILDEVVVIETPNTPRAEWRLATIEKLFRNRNGEVTDVELRIPNTNSDTKSKDLFLNYAL
uniref:DUF5641 domain-containing protein n=1 Tax=Syphacia muris TaxID=451379 RepID=A0A0N5B1J7_9BILA